MAKRVEQLDRVIIRFAGDSGDGMQLTGDRFSSETATLGNDTQEATYALLGRRQATELILTLSVYCAVARFTNATRAPIEAENPLATASNPNAPGEATT